MAPHWETSVNLAAGFWPVPPPAPHSQCRLNAYRNCLSGNGELMSQSLKWLPGSSQPPQTRALFWRRLCNINRHTLAGSRSETHVSFVCLQFNSRLNPIWKDMYTNTPLLKWVHDIIRSIPFHFQWGNWGSGKGSDFKSDTTKQDRTKSRAFVILLKFECSFQSYTLTQLQETPICGFPWN